MAKWSNGSDFKFGRFIVFVIIGLLLGLIHPFIGIMVVAIGIAWGGVIKERDGWRGY